jgi:hypothetical protein
VTTKFKDFFNEIKEEAKEEGPVAVEQLETLKKHFRHISGRVCPLDVDCDAVRCQNYRAANEK